MFRHLRSRRHLHCREASQGVQDGGEGLVFSQLAPNETVGGDGWASEVVIEDTAGGGGWNVHEEGASVAVATVGDRSIGDSAGVQGKVRLKIRHRMRLPKGAGSWVRRMIGVRMPALE